jgi:hypothetical protein
MAVLARRHQQLQVLAGLGEVVLFDGVFDVVGVLASLLREFFGFDDGARVEELFDFVEVVLACRRVLRLRALPSRRSTSAGSSQSDRPAS